MRLIRRIYDSPQSQNFIGISGEFECLWSYENGKFINTPSYTNGVAGLFIFGNKKCLSNIPQSGVLVEWLQIHHNFAIISNVEKLMDRAIYQFDVLIAH